MFESCRAHFRVPFEVVTVRSPEAGFARREGHVAVRYVGL
jgi:hypothetical protein